MPARKLPNSTKNVSFKPVPHVIVANTSGQVLYNGPERRGPASRKFRITSRSKKEVTVTGLGRGTVRTGPARTNKGKIAQPYTGYIIHKKK